MIPRQVPIDANSGLINMTDGSALKLGMNDGLTHGEALITGRIGGDQRPFTDGHTEQVGTQRQNFFDGHQMAGIEQGGQGKDARAILGRRRHVGGKRALVCRPTRRTLTAETLILRHVEGREDRRPYDAR